MNHDIFSYIKEEENRFHTEKVRIGENWHWSFKDHVQLLFHLKNGQFYTGENDYLRAFKNIMEPILNLAYWSEDIEVKDIVFFIENKNGRALSFLIKKYHDEVFIKQHNIDTFLDEITENDVDYGGVLVQKTNEPKPEVLDFLSIAFCDQTDILGGPIGFKFNFAPNKLRKMSKLGWGNEKNGANISIEDLILLAEHKKDPSGIQETGENATTGKNIEVYVVRGTLPDHYLRDNGDYDYYCDQVQVVAFYRDEKGNKKGVCLYRKEEYESSLKFHTSKKVYGRALGRGVGESLIQPQVWTNFLEIHKMNMLEAGSKVPLYTDDESYANRNQIQDMENLEITTVADGKRIFQVPTVAPANVQLFDKSINDLYEHAQALGAAYDPLLGKEQASGTTFRGQERVVAQGRGFHDRRRGQRAKFIEEIYRDWIIPRLVKEITSGKEFLATLTSDEVQWVSEQLAENWANRQQIDALLNGEMPRDKEELKQEAKIAFQKNGNRHILKILKDEFKDVEVKIGINVASKQKDLFGLTDKLLAIFQFVFTNPAGFQQVMQIPGMSGAFNDILEYSGINPVDFNAVASMNVQPMMQPQQQQQPLTLNAQAA